MGTDAMKTKAKKPVRKKPGVTAGVVFGRMVKEAKFFDYMAYGPDENPWDMEFVGFTQIDDYIVNVVDGMVVVDEIITCPSKTPVSIKGDTVEVKLGDHTYLFRFYVEPKRIENLGEVVK